MRGELGGLEKAGHVEREPQVSGPMATLTFSRKESHLLGDSDSKFTLIVSVYPSWKSVH